MAKEYIEREAAIKMIEEDLPEVVYYRKEDAIACLECLPSADVADIVRCKYCQRSEYNDYHGVYYCRKLRSFTNGEFYCAYGEEE